MKNYPSWNDMFDGDSTVDSDIIHLCHCYTEKYGFSPIGENMTSSEMKDRREALTRAIIYLS